MNGEPLVSVVTLSSCQPEVKRFPSRSRRRLQNRSRVCRNSAEDRAGVVNGFRKRIARLKAQPDARVILRHAGLQRVISGMRAVRHDVERAEAARDLPGRIKLCERRKARARPRISIREKDRGKMHAGRAYIRSAQFENMKIAIEARCPRPDVAVAKIASNRGSDQGLNLIARRKRSKIILKSLQINRRIRRNFGSVAGRKQKLPRGRVGFGKRYRSD